MRNSVLFLSLCFLVFSSVTSISDQYRWKISVLDENKESKPINVYKGVYTKAYLVLSAEEKITRLIPKIAKLELSNSAYSFIKTEKDDYEINTYKSLEYEIYIGADCSDSFKEGTAQLKFKKKGIDIFGALTFEEFTVNFKNSDSTLTLKPIASDIIGQSYGKLEISEKLLNVDPISITFTSKSGNVQGAYATDFVISKFDSDTEPPKVYGEYGLQPAYEAETSKQEFDVSTTNKCFKLSSSSISFNAVKGESTFDKDSVKSGVLNSLRQVASEEESTIELQFNVPVSPVNITCRISGLLPDEKSQTFETFIGKVTKNFRVKFSNLSRIIRYNVQCELKDNSRQNPKSFTFLIGTVKSSSVDENVFKVLKTMSKNSFPAQCATWKLKSSEITLREKFEEYCNAALSSASSKTEAVIGALANGCVFCEALKNQPSGTLKMCAAPSPICLTRYKKTQEEAKDVFKKMVEDLSSESKIKENIEVSNVVVDSTSIEVEDEAPSKDKIRAVLEENTDKKATFSLVSTNSKAIKCKSNKDLFNSVSIRYLLSDKLEKEFTLNPNEKKTLELSLEGSILDILKKFDDKKTYSLILDCSYLPDYGKNKFSTGPFIAGSFLYTKQSKQPDYPVATPVDCNKEKLHPQCIRQTVKDVYKTLKTELPSALNDFREDLENFARLSNIDQLTKLAWEKTELLKEDVQKSIQKFVPQAIKVVEYLSQRTCNFTSNYEKCREDKKALYEEIVGHVEQFVSCTNIKEIIINAKVGDNVEESLKYILTLISDLASNPDALKKETSEKITQLSNCALDQFKGIWSEVEPKLKKAKGEILRIKSDAITLIVDTINNLVDVVHFEEADQILEDAKKVVKDTRILISKKAKEVKSQLEEAVKNLIEIGDGLYELQNLKIDITINVNIEKKRRNRRNLAEAEESQPSLIEFPEQGVKVSINLDYLFDKYGAYAAQVMMYESYPLLSADNNVVSPYFVSIKFFDKESKEISVEGIPKNYLPIIYYSKSNELTNFKSCYYFNEKKEDLKNDGVSTSNVVLDGEEYVACSVKHFTDFTVASVDGGIKWWGVLLIILAIILVAGGAFMAYVFLRRGKSTGPEKMALTADN